MNKFLALTYEQAAQAAEKIKAGRNHYEVAKEMFVAEPTLRRNLHIYGLYVPIKRGRK